MYHLINLARHTGSYSLSGVFELSINEFSNGYLNYKGAFPNAMKNLNKENFAT